MSCKKVALNTPGRRFHRERSVKVKEKHQSNMKTKSEVQLKKTGAWKQCEDSCRTLVASLVKNRI